MVKISKVLGIGKTSPPHVGKNSQIIPYFIFEGFPYEKSGRTVWWELWKNVLGDEWPTPDSAWSGWLAGLSGVSTDQLRFINTFLKKQYVDAKGSLNNCNSGDFSLHPLARPWHLGLAKWVPFFPFWNCLWLYNHFHSLGPGWRLPHPPNPFWDFVPKFVMF